MKGHRQIMTDDILRLIVKNCTSLEEIQLGSCWKLTGEPLRMLFRDQERSRNLTLLRMSDCIYNTFHISRIISSSLSALRSISFNHCDQITDKLLILLDDCKCVLSSITIEGCKVTDVGVSALLSHQDELQTLVLKISELTGTGLEVLRSRKLKEVHLSFIQITNESLVALVTRNPTISRLNICYCDKLTHEVIPAIAVTLADELEHLTLIHFYNIENNDLVVLSQHCKNLEGLVLHVFSCSVITSARLRTLSKECTKLQLLDVSFRPGLEWSSSKEFLTELPVSLKKLVLARLQLEGGDIHTAVSRLPKLETLKLCGKDSVTEEHIMKLFDIVGPQLICLNMKGHRQIMTDDILRLIVKNCTSLEEIQLGSCWKLTGEPLRMLFRDQERSRNLTLLRMSDCIYVSFVLYNFLKVIQSFGNF
eukprot:XP_789678.2 PREDICTED: uncharacterized protein LOC584733 [Strongylocentrotus purpuratus]